MKNIIRIIPIVPLLCCAHAQTLDVPEWKAVVKVVDGTGQPVAGASVTIGYYVSPPPSEPTAIKTDAKRGVTDTNGVFSASGYSGSTNLFFGASKDGYYHSHLDYEFAQFKKNDPAKWNPMIVLLLKRIGTPTPMYAKSVNLGMPVFDKAAGFDLSVGDWVAPYGKGSRTDILFTAHLDKRAEYDSDYTLTVGFPNPGDGIQEFTVPRAGFRGSGSALRSSHQAPADGYQPQWVQTKTVSPGKGYGGNWDEDRNYYLRIRTVLDENGNVKSALYGKIYGDFMQFTYYLNPTPNDRNIEFDPKHNLLNLGLREAKVEAP